MSARDERVEAGARAHFDQGQSARRDAARLRPDGKPWEWDDLTEHDKRAHLAIAEPIILAALADDPAQAALARAYDDGYNDAATMARCYGHTDHWEDEPTNPYRAALAGGPTEGSQQ